MHEFSQYKAISSFLGFSQRSNQ